MAPQENLVTPEANAESIPEVAPAVTPELPAKPKRATSKKAASAPEPQHPVHEPTLYAGFTIVDY